MGTGKGSVGGRPTGPGGPDRGQAVGATGRVGRDGRGRRRRGVHRCPLCRTRGDFCRSCRPNPTCDGRPGPAHRYRAESGPCGRAGSEGHRESSRAYRGTPPEPRRTVHPTRSGSPPPVPRCAWPRPLVARGPQAPAKHPTPPLPACALHHERPRSRWSATGWSGAQSAGRNWVFSGKTRIGLKEVVWRLWTRPRFPRPMVSPTQVRLATRQHVPWKRSHSTNVSSRMERTQMQKAAPSNWC